MDMDMDMDMVGPCLKGDHVLFMYSCGCICQVLAAVELDNSVIATRFVDLPWLTSVDASATNPASQQMSWKSHHALSY